MYEQYEVERWCEPSFLRNKTKTPILKDWSSKFKETNCLFVTPTQIEIRKIKVLKYLVQILKPYDIITLIKLTGGVI